MAISGTDIVNYFSEGVFPRFYELINTPLTDPQILWTILPLLVTAFFVELYFGRYKTENIGWSSAFANCISLLWVTTALVRFTYDKHGLDAFTQWNLHGHTPPILLITIVAVWSLLLGIFNFYHVLPKKLAFFISSTIPVNVSAIIITILIIGEFSIDRITGTAAILLFILLAIIFATIQAIVRPAPEAKKYIENYKKKAEEKKKQREKNFYHHVDLLKERIKAQFQATMATVKGFFGRK